MLVDFPISSALNQTTMIIQRTDPRFWDVRVVERRIRRGELQRSDLEAYLDKLPDVSELSTISKPLEEPDDRARERRAAKAAKPSLIATRPSVRADDILDDDDDDDDLMMADDDDDDDDDGDIDDDDEE
ncbi:MAG: hypothetical protein JNJ46_28215 [Myxococcales bacterium]|nr:hypothetical protein [Myxococcales bacterium]